MDTIWYHPNVKYVNNNSELLLASKKKLHTVYVRVDAAAAAAVFSRFSFHSIPIRALMRWNASIYYLWLLFVLNVYDN